MDGLELLQTLNLANMNLTIQAIFQWFQKKVDSLGSKLEAYADGVSENRPNASKWNLRSPAPFTRGYLGFVWRLGSLATHERKFHRFHLQCHAPNQYELAIDSDSTCFIAYKVTVSDTRTERIPIKFTILSSDSSAWIYDLQSVLQTSYDPNTGILLRTPTLLRPEKPIINIHILYDKMCIYLHKLQKSSLTANRFGVYFYRDMECDGEGNILLNPTAFHAFSPPARYGTPLCVKFEADGDTTDACIKVQWTAECREYDDKYHEKSIAIAKNTDALALEQAIDQALRTLLPKKGTSHALHTRLCSPQCARWHALPQ